MNLDFIEYSKKIDIFKKDEEQEEEQLLNRLCSDKVFENDLNYRFLSASEKGENFINMSVENFPDYIREYFEKNSSTKSKKLLEKFSSRNALQLSTFLFNSLDSRFSGVTIYWTIYPF